MKDQIQGKYPYPKAYPYGIGDGNYGKEYPKRRGEPIMQDFPRFFPPEFEKFFLLQLREYGTWENNKIEAVFEQMDSIFRKMGFID